MVICVTRKKGAVQRNLTPSNILIRKYFSRFAGPENGAFFGFQNAPNRLLAATKKQVDALPWKRHLVRSSPLSLFGGRASSARQLRSRPVSRIAFDALVQSQGRRRPAAPDIRSSPPPARHRARPRVERHRARHAGRGDGRFGGRRHGRGGRLHAPDRFRARSRRATVGPLRARSAARFRDALPGRPAVRPRQRLYQPAPRHRGRPDRGQCAAWRPHVDARQPDRGGADRVVERRRRFRRAGGGLYPVGERHRLQDRPGLPAAPVRHAHSGGRGLGRGHRRRLRRAARRRLLRLRADHRQLHGQFAGAGGRRLPARLSGGAGPFAQRARHRGGRGLHACRARPRHRRRLRRAGRHFRHRADARRCRLRAAVRARAHQSLRSGP